MKSKCGLGFVLLSMLLWTAASHAQLTLHLTFDDAGQLTSDSSGNAHVPFVLGAPTATTGVSGGAAVFDGGTYLRWGPAVAATLAGSFSVSLWVQTTQSYGSNNMPGWAGVGIVYADVPGQTNDTVPIALTGNVAGFMTSDGVQDTTIHTGSAINTGSFIHLAATYDLTTGVKRLYYNGVLQATETVNPTPVNARNLFFLGANDFDARFFVGAVDDFQFYSVALGPDDISFLHANPGLAVIPEPTAWPLALSSGVLLAAIWRRRRASFARVV